MADQGLSTRAVARLVPCDPALISRYANGKRQPSLKVAARLDEILGAGGELTSAAASARAARPAAWPGADLAAVEVARRTGATSVGTAGVERLELHADELAVAYHSTPPRAFLDQAGRSLGYVT